MKRLVFIIAIFALVPTALCQLQADPEPLVFASAAEQARFEKLAEELRCLVCQNQNLADSDAPLAHDLRKEIHAMMQAGQSDDEIKQFLTARYGDFVLYRPPVQGNTLLLWLAPGMLLIAGAVALFVNIRKRGRETSSARHAAND